LSSLAGRTALVTGGAIGIGRGIAADLARHGADVAVTYHTHEPENVMDEIKAMGRRCEARQVDVTDSAAVSKMVESVVESVGPLDIVVANAGHLIARVPVATMTDDHWKLVLDTNLSSAFFLARAVLPHLKSGSGRLIFMSSMAGRNGGGPGTAAYAAAKAGLLGLTMALAKELAPRQIGVYAVTPGLILETPFHETFTPVETQNAAIARLLAGRAGVPADVAAVVTFLSGPGGEFLSGSILNIAGGQDFA
jgi:3-oxoacyl-[acyl-carrier protein] reductase